MVYVSDFVPVTVEDEIDVDHSLVEFGNTDNDDKELYTLFKVLECADYFKSQQVLGLIFHSRDDNDVYISVFHHIKDGKTPNEDVNKIINGTEPLILDYNRPIDGVQSEYESLDKDIIYSPKLGYAIKLDEGYIVTVNSSSFYTNLCSDYHVYCDKYFKLDKDIESKWFRKQKLVHEKLVEVNEVSEVE